MSISAISQSSSVASVSVVTNCPLLATVAFDALICVISVVVF